MLILIGYFTHILCAGALYYGIVKKSYIWPTRIGGIFCGLTGESSEKREKDRERERAREREKERQRDCLDILYISLMILIHKGFLPTLHKAFG